jgi:hypothetical protein
MLIQRSSTWMCKSELSIDTKGTSTKIVIFLFPCYYAIFIWPSHIAASPLHSEWILSEKITNVKKKPYVQMANAKREPGCQLIRRLTLVEFTLTLASTCYYDCHDLYSNGVGYKQRNWCIFSFEFKCLLVDSCKNVWVLRSEYKQPIIIKKYIQESQLASSHPCGCKEWCYDVLTGPGSPLQRNSQDLVSREHI